MKIQLKNIGIVLFISTSVVIQSSARIITHWNLDESSSSSIINDSVSGLTASPAGGSTPVLGEDGLNNDTSTASMFSNNGYWRSEADTSLAPTNFSIAFWVRGSNVLTTASHATIIGTRNGEIDDMQY